MPGILFYLLCFWFPCMFQLKSHSLIPVTLLPPSLSQRVVLPKHAWLHFKCNYLLPFLFFSLILIKFWSNSDQLTKCLDVQVSFRFRCCVSVLANQLISKRCKHRRNSFRSCFVLKPWVLTTGLRRLVVYPNGIPMFAHNKHVLLSVWNWITFW